MSDDKEFWTPQEFCERYRCNYKTVLADLRAGKIAGGFRVGRLWRIDKALFEKANG